MLFDIGKRNEWTIANVLNSPFFCFQRRELGLGGQPRIKDVHSAAKNLKTPWDSSGPPFFHIWLQHSTAFKIMIPRNQTQKTLLFSHHQPDKQWRFLASQLRSSPSYHPWPPLRAPTQLVWDRSTSLRWCWNTDPTWWSFLWPVTNLGTLVYIPQPAWLFWLVDVRIQNPPLFIFLKISYIYI